MSIISIWTRNALAYSDLPAFRFVDPLGKLGGFSGIIVRPVQKGDTAPIITLGEAEVEYDSIEPINIGDKVIGNDQGLAVKSTTDQGLLVLEIFERNLKVLVR